MATNEEMLARGVAILHALRYSHLSTTKLSRRVGQSFEKTRRDLERLERNDLVTKVYRAESRHKWRLSDRVVVCMKCHGCQDDHRLAKTRDDGFIWVCLQGSSRR